MVSVGLSHSSTSEEDTDRERGEDEKRERGGQKTDFSSGPCDVRDTPETAASSTETAASSTGTSSTDVDSVVGSAKSLCDTTSETQARMNGRVDRSLSPPPLPTSPRRLSPAPTSAADLSSYLDHLPEMNLPWQPLRSVIRCACGRAFTYLVTKVCMSTAIAL